MWFHFIETFRTLKNEKLRKWSELRQVCRCRASRLSHCWCLGIKSAEDSWPVMIFFLFFPPLDPSSMLLLYILSRRAESHGLAFMRMWHYQNAHMTVHQLWLLTKWHRKTFRTSSLSDMTFFQDSTLLQDMPDPPPPPPHPVVSTLLFFLPPISMDVRLFCERCHYLLLADRAMNSDPKWNSYCYQQHKISITLDVRAKKRKWSRYS